MSSCATLPNSDFAIVDFRPAIGLTGIDVPPNMPAQVSMARHGARRTAHFRGKHRDIRMLPTVSGAARHDWTLAEVESLFALPFVELMFHAQRVHQAHHEPSTVQMSTLLSIKTGACPEDCAYCPQSVRYDTGLERETLLNVAEVREAAQRAKAAGATRFCMGAAYRSPKPKQVAAIAEMIREVRALGLETCATLGMLTPAQACELRDAGLDYYNHNLDTSPEFYGEIITTRTYQDRLDTLGAVRDAGLKVCCRHCRHGRNGDGSREAAAHTRQSARASGKRADQSAGAGAGNPATRQGARRSFRFRAHDRRCSPHDAEVLRASVRGPRSDER